MRYLIAATAVAAALIGWGAHDAANGQGGQGQRNASVSEHDRQAEHDWQPGVALRPHVRHLRACPSDEGESAYPCAWYAPGMGNGQGHSFRIYRDGRVKTITDRRAFALLGDCDSDGPLYCRQPVLLNA